MKVIDILKQKHTVIMTMDGYNAHQGLQDYTQVDLSMYEILYPLATKFKKTIDLLRMEEYHSDRYNYIKEHMLPVWFVGGTFPKEEVINGNVITHTEDKNLLTYSNIISIDIDNQEIDRKAIFDLPYVFAVLKSAGGTGYYILILVENGLYTKEYYSYLAKMLKFRFNIDVDEQCKNIGRKRVLSFEEDIDKWIKPLQQDITPWKLKETVVIDDLFDNKPKRLIDYKPRNSSNSNNIDIIRKAIWKLLDNGFSIDNYLIHEQKSKYNVWYYTACEFANFDDGYNMFVKFSQNSTKYNDDITTITKKWNNANKNNTNIDDIAKKWCGMCKSTFGRDWYNNV